MAGIAQKITNCLWFDSQAEEAVALYTSLFKNTRIGAVTRYGKAGFEFHGKPEGSVMTITFYLDGQEFLALNGGPKFRFNESMSLIITCEDQNEIDYFWNRLTENGGEESYCGWLKDKFGVSWQLVASGWTDMINDPDATKTKRVMEAMFTMQKPIISVLEAAFRGE